MQEVYRQPLKNHENNEPVQLKENAQNTPNLPAAWFIDSALARRMDIRIPASLSWASIEGVRFTMTVDDGLHISEKYFSTAHVWLPVVSRIRIMRFLNESPTLTAADTVALFVAMHLLACDYSPETKEVPYQSLKAALAACERNGQYTTNYVAAEVLTAVYEIGHGIYPAAYMTIGTCARICYAIGLHDKRSATQLPGKIDSWTEMEERRRLWWATIILDRYVNTGFTFRPLCIPTLPPNEIVPACDDSWDRGELAVNPLLVMSIEAEVKVSPYSRTCQASHLLGRVCQHANEHADPSDDDFHFEEAHQLERAANALLSILQEEFQDRAKFYKLFNALAICYSALLKLYSVHSCIEIELGESTGRNKGIRLDFQQLAIDGAKRTSSEVLNFAGEIRKAMSLHPDAISPFTLHCLYQAATQHGWYARGNGIESHLASLEEIRTVLKAVQKKWSVAGEYLDLLKGIEFQINGG